MLIEGGGLLALLPRGTDRLVASFLGAPQGLYCLACSHRHLGRFISFVERLDNLTPERLESLLNYFQCGVVSLPYGDVESDADVEYDDEYDKRAAVDEKAPGTQKTNDETEDRLPLLRHLHFDTGYEWAVRGGREESGDKQIQSHTRATLFGLALKQQHSFRGGHLFVPNLESLDLSETFMSDADLDCVINGLGQTRRLWKLFLPGFPTNGLRQERSARLETIDFARRYGGAHVVTRPGDLALFPSRRLLHSLRILRLDGPLQAQAKRWFSDAVAAFRDEFTREVGQSFQTGAISALEELSLTNCVPELNAESAMDMANGIAQAPADVTRRLEILRLRGYALGGFESAVALVTAFTGMGSPPDGRWAGLRVLDLSDNLLGDIGLERLAESMAAGVFSPALEEIDLSLNRHIRRSQQSTIGPAGIQALVRALQTRRWDGWRGAGGIRLKRLRLGGQYIGDDGVAELMAGWKGELGCWDALEELKLNENRLTDESVRRIITVGMIAVPSLPLDNNMDDGDRMGASTKQSKKRKIQPQKQPVLLRLVLERNEIRGGHVLRTQLQHILSFHRQPAPSWDSSIKRLNLARNPLTAEGMTVLVQCLGSSLQELKLGGNSNGIGDNDAMARKLWAFSCVSPSLSSSLSRSSVSAPCSPLADLRRLDIRRLPISRTVVEEFMIRLHGGKIFPRLCQIELAVADVRRKRDMAILAEELKQARGPRVVWDILTINKTFPPTG
ncbi:hypothetical protein VYU27_008137 [Nannochloropsis oceanica]